MIDLKAARHDPAGFRALNETGRDQGGDVAVNGLDVALQASSEPAPHKAATRKRAVKKKKETEK